MASLFTFGTLRDADLFAVVAGRPLDAFPRRRARLAGYRAVHALGCPFPVARVDAGAAMPGLLVESLDDEAMARLAFYESGGYDLTAVSVRAGGRDHAAVAFLTAAPARPSPAAAPYAALLAGDEPWRIARWRREAKRHAVAAAAEAMALFGRVTVAELDRLWPEIECAAAARLATATG